MIFAIIELLFWTLTAIAATMKAVQAAPHIFKPDPNGVKRFIDIFT